MFGTIVLEVFSLLIVSLPVSDSRWTGYSFNNLCGNQSCLQVTNTRSGIRTTPIHGTCGDKKGDSVWNGTMIFCTDQCPYLDQTYPRGDTINVSNVLSQEFEFWSYGCALPESNNQYNGDYDSEYSYPGGSGSSNGEPLAPCFTQKFVSDYTRSTHTFWIKPLEHVRKGTLVSFNKYPRPSILLMNSRLVMHADAMNSYIYLDNSVYIPSNQWTHVGLQMISGNFPYMEVFINGSYIGSFQLRAQPAAFKRKKRAAYGRISTMNIALGISSNVFRNYEGFQTYPLQIQQCIDIGYSASVAFLCPRGRSDFGVRFNPGFNNCSDTRLGSQSYLASTYLSDDHELSMYKCPYDRRIISLFTCGYFLPAFSYNNPYRGKYPCKSLCEEFYDNCGSYLTNIPNLNSNCAIYPQVNCITRDYLPDVGIYKGLIMNYDIYNKTLTSREMKVVGDVNTNVLPLAKPMTNCLCPANHPSLFEPDGMKCVSNEYNRQHPEIAPVDFSYRFGFRSDIDYHFKEYVLDSNPFTNWISSPGVEQVSLDISFHDTVQVLGVSIQMVSAAPVYTSAERFPMELYMLDVSDEWKLSAVLTNDSVKCRNFVSNKPAAVKCFVYKDITESYHNLITYHIDLLHNLQNFYNRTHMDLDLVTALHAKGLRLQFNGFSKDKNKQPNPKYLYHVVTDINVQGRHYSGTTMCGCYLDGTDLTRTCDETTGQCPCRSGYIPQYTGKTCHPYVSSVSPGYGPKSGGTEVEILGGLFGNGEPSVYISIRNRKIGRFEILSSNDTVIRIRTGMLNTGLYPLEQPLKISVTLYNGYVILTDFTFTYKEDPVIYSIQPLATFLQGGIQQTVIGDHLNSVFKPYLKITFIDHGLKLVPIYTVCSIVNDTVMFCPSPDLSSIQGVVLSNGELEGKMSTNDDNYVEDDDEKRGKFRRDLTSHISRRVRRQITDSTADPGGNQADIRFKVNSNNRLFYVGLELDGVEIYRNITRSIGPQFGTLTVFIDPEIEKFDPEIIVFKPFEGDEHLFVKGRKLNLGCGMADYSISLGGGICNVLDLSSNKLVCKAPSEAPKSSTFLLKDDAHKVVCRVGNIEVNLGYVRYCMNALCEGSVLAGVVFVCIIAVIVLLLLLLFLLYKFNVINLKKCLPNKDTKPEDTVKYQNNQELACLVRIEPATQPKPLLERLKEYDFSLYETVVKSQLECSKMSLGKQIGQGNFGSVNEGYYLLQEDNIQVAVKSMKTETDDVEKVAEFLEEGTIMMEFKHENVLTILGVVIEHDTPYIVLPFMEHGDLKCYLSNPNNRFTCGDLIDYAAQVARGMSYLSDLHFVHRDLAARNCMINKDQVVKIADFGLSRDIYEKDYYAVQNKSRPMPVKWMAIECLDNFKFTSKSDVWSFGVTLWEILMRGCVPFPTVPNYNIKEYILHGNQLKQPPFCPDSVFSLMVECWNHNSDQRPTFCDIVTRLEEFLTNARHIQKQDQETGEEEGCLDHGKSVAREKVYDTMVDLNGEYRHGNYSNSSAISPSVDNAIYNLSNNNDVSKDEYLVPLSVDDKLNSESTNGYLIPISQPNESKIQVDTSENQLEPVETSTNQETDGYLAPVSSSDISSQPIETNNNLIEPVGTSANQRTDEYLAPVSLADVSSQPVATTENQLEPVGTSTNQETDGYLAPVSLADVLSQPVATTENQLEPSVTSANQETDGYLAPVSLPDVSSQPVETDENQVEPVGTSGNQETDDYLAPVSLADISSQPVETSESQLEPVGTSGNQETDEYLAPVSLADISSQPVETDNNLLEPFETSENQLELVGTSENQLEPVGTSANQETDGYLAPVSLPDVSSQPVETDENQVEPVRTSGNQETDEYLTPDPLADISSQPVETSEKQQEPVHAAVVQGTDNMPNCDNQNLNRQNSNESVSLNTESPKTENEAMLDTEIELNNENEETFNIDNPVQGSNDYLELLNDSDEHEDSEEISELPKSKKNRDVKIGSIFMHNEDSLSEMSDSSCHNQPEGNAQQQQQTDHYVSDNSRNDQSDEDSDVNVEALKPVDTMYVDLNMDNSFSNT